MKLQNHRAHLGGGTVANLIFALLALGLCGLCTFQFSREGQLRVTLENLSRTNATVTGELEDARKEGARWKAEVTEVSKHLVDNEALVQSNKVELTALKTLLRSTSNTVVSVTSSRDAFKERFEQQAEITRKAVEATKKLKTDAEAEIKKIAAVAEERTATANKYAADYKELVEAFEKFRAQAQAAK